MKLSGWWKSRSSAGKVELYTRWSFHLFVVLEIASVGLAVLGSMDGKASAVVSVALFLTVCAHSVLVGFLSSRSLDWILGRRERPVRLAATVTGLTAAVCLGVLGVGAAGLTSDPVMTPTVIAGTTCFTTGTLVLCLPKVRQMRYVPPAAAAFVGLASLAFGVPAGESMGVAVGVLLTSAFLCAACGFSGWLLDAVYELDRTREVRAQLAVAEERLRFGRDLHDVMGRNLAVIALKSELAVQLARRERPEAVDQMIEVQRIARESQKEVRDVVRGYRDANLAVELEGARGVLRAAGMDCLVEYEQGRELPAEAQSALGWVVREATTNILRHGDARRCVIRLTAAPSGALTLVVENDGAPKAPAGPPGSGLAGLRERLAVLDGTLEAGPVDGGRFRLRARIPGPAAGPIRELEARA